MVLLDTCTLLWLAGDQSRLSREATERLQAARGFVYVSAISAFEIGIKHRKRALVLPMDPGAWYPEALEFHGVKELPVSGAVALASTALPALHSDPCDRIIVATAKANDLTILTPDPLIAAYPEARVSW